MQLPVKKFATYLIISIILTLGLSISMQSLLADWTAPSASPPGNNISKPLYATSSVPQMINKESGSGGSLGVEGNFSVGDKSYFAGNVGIGTTSPDHALVVGPAGGGRHLVINDCPDARWGFSTGGYDLTIQNDFDGTGDCSGGGNWTSRVIINQDGNVGIGTTTPQEVLVVDGNIHATGDITCDGNCTLGNTASTTITTYSDSCDQCNRTTDMGSHDFCALANVAGPGGFNTQCKVYQSGDIWILHLIDGDAGQTHSCAAICIDGIGGSSSTYADGGEFFIPNDIKTTSATHNGNFDTDGGLGGDSDGVGYEEIQTFLNDNDCSGYHVCNKDELISYITKNNINPNAGWINGDARLSGGGSSWYTIGDCTGWTDADIGDAHRANIWTGTVFGMNGCNVLNEVLCCSDTGSGGGGGGGGATIAEIQCYGQGGAAHRAIGWISDSCQDMADLACEKIAGCVRNVVTADGTLCSWTCN